TRRELLKGLASTAAVPLGSGPAIVSAIGSLPQQSGRLVGNLKFLDEPRLPLDTPLDEELDGRLYSDVSRVNSKQLLTPSGTFYIRSRAPSLLPPLSPWKIKVNGLVESAIQLDAAEIIERSKPMGVHLMECAGNNRATRFGLLSVAEWSGV